MKENSTKNKIVDYDLYGIVGIRQINPSERDINNLAKSYSSFRSELDREPDIIIRYKIDWQLGDISYLGLDEAGFNEDGFYILTNGRSPLKVKIPFEQLGDKCEIVCEQGIGSIPLLNQIINLTFLKKNYLPVHASAFLHNDLGALVIGWSKGGKTEALFSFIKKGAKFVGDETVLISPDGKKMFGIPVPVSIWEWQFSEIKELMPPVSMQKKIQFKGIHLVDNAHRVLGTSILKNYSFVKMIGDALPALRRQLNIRLGPNIIFKGRTYWKQVNLNRVIIIMSHNKDVITIDKCNTVEIADRMIISSLYELDSFYSYYSKFKFAFPGIKNDFLENIDEVYYKLLPNAIASIESYQVLHPYPVSFEKLYKGMKPIFYNNN
ncbi:MAG TPA: hypothetical protein VKA26_06590 [Ignavibacteriaceae bacterium]|nr:hypothetical protein [Ignavibacteriaceae bacterium]